MMKLSPARSKMRETSPMTMRMKKIVIAATRKFIGLLQQQRAAGRVGKKNDVCKNI